MCLFGIVGCRNVVCEDDDFELRDDGLCYEVADDTTITEVPPTLDDVLDELPRCDPRSVRSEVVDAERGCAGPVCLDRAVGDVAAASSEEPICDPSGTGYVYCWWQSVDVGAYVGDANGDGIPDPDFLLYRLYVGEDFPGATDEGLAWGVSVRCAVEAWGTPQVLEVAAEGRKEWVTRYHWERGAHWIAVYDDVRGDGDEGDGRAEWLALY